MDVQKDKEKMLIQCFGRILVAVPRYPEAHNQRSHLLHFNVL
jgi:hypothetical protein